MADFPTGERATGDVQQVFLLEDAAGGGLILNANKMQRLPPWPDGVAELLSSVCGVVYALPTLQSAGLGTEAEAFLECVLAEAGRQLEGCTGRLNAGSQVVYLGKAGGFACEEVPWTRPMPLSAGNVAPPPNGTALCGGNLESSYDATYDDPWEQLLGWERAR